MENHGGMILTGEHSLILLPQLSGNAIRNHPVANQKELGKENYEHS
jgi:hypothetical protein